MTRIVFFIAVLLVGLAVFTALGVFSGSTELPSTHQTVDMTTDTYQERVRSELRLRWRELNAVRYDPEFHRYGIHSDGPMADWAAGMRALREELEKHERKNPEARLEHLDLKNAINVVLYTATDWATTDGGGTDQMREYLPLIQAELYRESS